jgi:hypothetical protein
MDTKKITREEKIVRMRKLVQDTKDSLGGFNATYQLFADGLTEAVSELDMTIHKQDIKHWIDGKYLPNRTRVALIYKFSQVQSWQRQFASRALDILDGKTTEEKIAELGY